jgi:hypothetical protein
VHKNFKSIQKFIVSPEMMTCKEFRVSIFAIVTLFRLDTELLNRAGATQLATTDSKKGSSWRLFVCQPEA